MSIRSLTWFRCLLVVSATIAVGATTVHDAGLNFRLELPEGFEPYPKGLPRKEIIYAFRAPAKELPRMGQLISAGGRIRPGAA